jgi:DNA-directed RNA polymerase specialized sigma24 family protein
MEQAGAVPGTVRRSAAEAESLVVAVVQRDADLVLRASRKGSLFDDDAADAYQRGIELFLLHAHRLEAETAHSWLYRVIQNEVASVRAQRQRILGPVAVEPGEREARHLPSPEEQVLGREQLAHAHEALNALKADELRALCLQACGQSSNEFAELSGWTRTKVNRALVEGRRRLQTRRLAIDSGEECTRWRPVLAALVGGRATARQLADVRPHLRNCHACRAQVRHLYRAGGGAGTPSGRDAAAA